MSKQNQIDASWRGSMMQELTAVPVLLCMCSWFREGAGAVRYG